MRAYYCHRCGEFTRAMHIEVCPECRSDFIEILDVRFLGGNPLERTPVSTSNSFDDILQNLVNRPRLRRTANNSTVENSRNRISNIREYELIFNRLFESHFYLNRPAKMCYFESLDVIECVIFCGICLRNKKGLCVEFDCRHAFHRKCVLPWIKHKGTCPNCRWRLGSEIS